MEPESGVGPSSLIWLLRTNTLSISFGMHTHYQGLYLCVAALLTFKHTRPTVTTSTRNEKGQPDTYAFVVVVGLPPSHLSFLF